MLLKKVWGDNVVGVIMPNGAQKDLQDALDIVKTINLKHYVIDIKETDDYVNFTLSDYIIPEND